MPDTAPFSVQFSNTSSGDNLSYRWDFGDGETSTEVEPQHTFQDGVFNITLSVENENGTATTSAQLVVLPPQMDDDEKVDDKNKKVSDKGTKKEKQTQ